MALSLEDANKVFQKVNIALDSLGANSEIRDSFRALKAYLSQIKRNPQLQFVPITNLTTDTAIADSPCTLYAVFLKKRNTATASYTKINDNASTAGGASGANMTDLIELNAAGAQAVLVIPAGRAQATGIAMASETTGAGGTDTSSGDGPDGFVILGA